MSENNRPVAEPLQKTAQTAQMVKGAIKTGKAIAGAAKGAAAGGPYGAAIGLVWGNRKLIGKIIIAVIAVLMIPIMIICMLPSIIFGGLVDAFSPDDPDTPILNSSTVINDNLTEISTSVSTVLSESLADTLAAIESDYANCTADGKEIINPHESSPNFNANLFVGQYCAAKNEDYTSVSITDMENTLRNSKDKLYSYTKKEEDRTIETVTVTVTVDADTGKEIETETVTTTVEHWVVYTICAKIDHKADLGKLRAELQWHDRVVCRACPRSRPAIDGGEIALVGKGNSLFIIFCIRSTGIESFHFCILIINNLIYRKQDIFAPHLCILIGNIRVTRTGNPDNGSLRRFHIFGLRTIDGCRTVIHRLGKGRDRKQAQTNR